MENEGKFDELKGRAKEGAGDLLGDDELKEEGQIDQAKGTIKEKLGQAAEKAGDLADKAADKLNEIRNKNKDA